MVLMAGKRNSISNLGGKRKLYQGLTLKQVGASPVNIKGRTYFRVGGGVFTKKEILRSRIRFARTKGLKVPKKQVGL